MIRVRKEIEDDTILITDDVAKESPNSRDLQKKKKSRIRQEKTKAKTRPMLRLMTNKEI